MTSSPALGYVNGSISWRNSYSPHALISAAFSAASRSCDLSAIGTGNDAAVVLGCPVSPQDTFAASLFVMVQHMQTQVTALNEAFQQDRQQREVDRNEALRLEQSRRDADVKTRLDDQQYAQERYAVLESQQQVLQSSVSECTKASSAWVCPVCVTALSTMRSFKAHMKRLYEYTNTVPADGKVPRCCLSAGSKRHVQLVALSLGGSFTIRSKSFATALWMEVQNLTSSDDCPLHSAPVLAIEGNAAGGGARSGFRPPSPPASAPGNPGE